MALSSVTAGSQAAAADLNQYKDHLEGASGATLAWFLRAASSQNVVIRLSDAAGVQKLSIQDSAGSEVAAIDSNGGLTVAGSFTPGTLTLPTGSAPTPTTEGEVWWDSDDDQFVVGDGTGQVAIGAGTTDHGTLFGLADDDHTIYLKDKAAGGTASEVPTHDHSVAAQAGTVAHSVTTGKTENDHHNRSHAMTSTSDHTATAHRMFVSDASGNVDEIALGANTTFLESNGTTAVPAFRTIVHGDLGSVGANDHHNESHTVASHSDTTATGTELNTLTDGSNADSLHTHAGLATIRKASNETVNSSTTLQNDNDFQISVSANEDLLIWGTLLVSSGATPDIKFQWSAPSGAVCEAQIISDPGSVVDFNESTAGVVATDGTTQAMALSAVYRGGANAGTLILQWAQNNSDAGNTTLENGSSIAYVTTT